MLFSYKMKDDTGFAPNPFHGVLTLATYKPGIRETKRPGNYIAGFTSADLCGDRVGEERLLFIMKVTEKMNYDTYYNHPGFQIKKPTIESRLRKSGDNIYFKRDGDYKQGLNFFHIDDDSIRRDLKSDKVLVSKEFFYFGSGAIPVDKFKINVPRYQSPYGVKTSNEKIVKDLWTYLDQNFQKNIALNPPHQWEEREVFNSLSGCR